MKTMGRISTVQVCSIVINTDLSFKASFPPLLFVIFSIEGYTIREVDDAQTCQWEGETIHSGILILTIFTSTLTSWQSRQCQLFHSLF
ncbi:Uncharacterized protein APZ42_014865 [Daphnia magna]|uniref:Uncharacterized protein n=1 Tax=Daphnia magna TaxID=35525 RepID=A0A162NWX8_9CRUS|nr:Uncharacterized protein APZ42_014865 [Daphnia magna]